MNRTVLIAILVLLSSLPFVNAFELVSITAEGAIAVPGGFVTGPRADVTATFSDRPDDTVRFVFLVPGDTLWFIPNTCDDRSCTVGSVPLAASRITGVYIATGSTDWYDERISISADTSPPELTMLSVTSGPSSTVSFEASDASGSGSYRLVRDGTTIAQGDGLSASVPLAEPITPGGEARFALVLTDAFGTMTTEAFGGKVPDEPPSIDAIGATAFRDSNGDGYIFFETSGDIATVAVLIGSRTYPAICSSGSCYAQIPNPAASETVVVRATDTFGSTASRSASVSFIADTVAPIFDRISAPFSSYDGTTGYADGTVYVDFVENAMMRAEDVIVSIDNRRTTARSCVRVGSLIRCSVPMTSDGTIDFRQAKDAAGNDALIPTDALTEREISTDSTPPRVRILAISSAQGTSQADTVNIGVAGQIQLIANIAAEGSEASRARVTMRTSDTTVLELALDCTLQSVSVAQCTSEPITITEPSRLVIEIFDASRIAYRAQRLVTLGGMSAPGSSGWEVIETTEIPGYYVPGAQMPVTIEARIGSDALSSAVSIAGVSIGSCTGIEGAFASAYERTIVITGFSDPDALTSGSGSCDVSIMTSRSGRIDPNPEELEIGFTLAPIASARIEDPLKNYERGEGAAKFDAVLATSQKVLAGAEAACNAYDGLSLASVSVNLAAATSRGVPPVYATLSIAGGALFSSVDELSPIAEPMCAIAKCEIPLEWFGVDGEKKDTTLQEVLVDWYNATEFAFREDINEFVGTPIVAADQKVLDVRDSLVLSTISVCLPGVIDNVREYAQATCAHDLCMLQVHTGDYAGSAASCRYTHAMYVCSEVVGEVFAVVPWVRTVASLTEQLGSAVRQPFRTIADWGIGLAARALLEAVPELKAIASADLSAAIQGIGITQTAGAAQNPPPDYCSDLTDYLEELEERGIFE